MNRLLVANRGEIARRIFATCRRLGVSTAAVYAGADAAAPFVREADVSVALGEEPMAYLDGAAIITAATRVGADAIHPGYGFLSENAGFAQAVLDAGLVWVGPSPQAISAMGSKTEARTRMQAAGVPVLPGSYDLNAAAIGFPLLVKASAGGGGKGMRIVESASELSAAVEAARREALSAFGDATVFLERYAPDARHVEIQIVGDQHGRVVSLHERDCSVQRRHQKIIEEAPSPAIDAEARAAMSAAAVAAGQAIGYVGAGTVEFLLDGRDFYFLEVNTRLQVEHPVTEAITGLDLVELQLRVASGERVPDPPPIDGHAIEARLYAEDPANGFLPVTGTLEHFHVPGDARVDTGVESGSVITPHYDPMIAKVIVHGRTRAEAARRLADTLARSEVQGMVTNRDFLVRVLRSPAFLSGRADTGWLGRSDIAALTAPLLGHDEARLAALAAALARDATRHGAGALASLPLGWRNNPALPQRARFTTPSGREIEVTYRLDRTGRQLVEPAGAQLHALTPREVDLSVGGVRRRYRIGPAGVSTADGEISLSEAPRFRDPTAVAAAGSLMSPMPGTVLRVAVEPGAAVVAGATLIVIEAMKMEQEIVAPADGIVERLLVAVGDQVQAGAPLAVIEDVDSDSPRTPAT